MKKLMIALAVVAMTAGVQAATWTWGTPDGANYVDSNGTVQQSGTFVLMYLGNGTSADWSLASAANVRSTAALSYENPLPGVIDPYNTVSKGYNLVSGTDVNGMWYGVMLKDGDNYVQLEDYSTGDALAAKQLSGFTDASSTIADFKFATANYTAAVPEPTSGLLLLLGMAGLALKRKRA